MSQIRGLRVLVKQFLSAAADEIMEAVEKIIVGYEEEMFQYKREIRSNRFPGMPKRITIDQVTWHIRSDSCMWATGH